MWNWTDHMGAWWSIGLPAMLAVVVFIAYGIWWLAREAQSGRGSRPAEDVLLERFARGELTESQFRRQQALVRR